LLELTRSAREGVQNINRGRRRSINSPLNRLAGELGLELTRILR
jgi:hypothetical protein